MNKSQWNSKIKAALKEGKEYDEDYSLCEAIQDVAVKYLCEADYKAWWAGENGNEGYPTRSVNALLTIASQLIEKEDNTKSIDFQIWDKGSVFVGTYSRA